MSDGRTYGDQRLRGLEQADDDDGPRGVLAKKMLAALLAFFLIAGVSVTSYRAGRASWQEPIPLGRGPLPETRQTPAKLPSTLPQPASPHSSYVDIPPPVARMLEARSRSQALVAIRRVDEQAAILASKEHQSPRAPEFHPSRRVLVARRALVQPQRVLYASKVVQLGEYPNRRQAKAAYARLVRVYPYLKTLPSKIESVRPRSGSARAYHLRSRAYSPDHARVLCQNLVSIGRGCAVLPEPW
jgi:hypothetical protein